MRFIGVAIVVLSVIGCGGGGGGAGSSSSSTTAELTGISINDIFEAATEVSTQVIDYFLLEESGTEKHLVFTRASSDVLGAVEIIYQPKNNGEWESIEKVATVGFVGDFQAGIDANGNIQTVWYEPNVGVRVMSRVGGIWNEVITLSSTGSCPSLSVKSQRSMVSWCEPDGKIMYSASLSGTSFETSNLDLFTEEEFDNDTGGLVSGFDPSSAASSDALFIAYRAHAANIDLDVTTEIRISDGDIVETISQVDGRFIATPQLFIGENGQRFVLWKDRANSIVNLRAALEIGNEWIYNNTLIESSFGLGDIKHLSWDSNDLFFIRDMTDDSIFFVSTTPSTINSPRKVGKGSEWGSVELANSLLIFLLDGNNLTIQSISKGLNISNISDQSISNLISRLSIVESGSGYEVFFIEYGKLKRNQVNWGF